MSQILSPSQLLELKTKELELLRRKKQLEAKLPHLYFPMYAWQREVLESDNRVNLLTAANQIGKSSALIRRQIANATDPARWKKIFGLKNRAPTQFWYFYPDSLTLEKEIDTKWVPEWLPRKEMESDPQYGWRLKKKQGTYFSCEFLAGPIVYFQMYTKSLASVQAGSVYEITADEELPMDFYSELMFRLTATGGIFTSGFTPTLNQLFWKQCMEGNKILPSAKKMTISMYDCLTYEDGTPSTHITIDKIRLAEERCKNDTERQRRIYGKFVTEEGRTYYAFEFEKNVVVPYDISGWNIYAAVDYGSGDDPSMQKKKKNSKNHPAAITFVAVRPDFKKGAVFKSWRGDHVKTTAGDVYNKYEELASQLMVTQKCYDPGAVDFGTIAERNSNSFNKADKSRDKGEDLLNTLFKYKMLDIFDDDPESLKLAGELMSLMVSNQTSENKSGDDLSDSLRYNVMQIPWDLSAVNEKIKNANSEEPKVARPMTEAEFQAEQIRLRRGDYDDRDRKDQPEGWHELEEEFDYWNEEYSS